MSNKSVARKPAQTPAAPPTPPAPAPNLKAVRDALNEIDLVVSRIRVVARTLDQDFYESVLGPFIPGQQQDPDDDGELFLVYCDSLKQAAARISDCTGRAFAAAAGESAS